MSKARELCAAYAAAGYRKIHLDASMFLSDDKGDRSKPLSDEVVAARVVDLCRVCEAAGAAPLYIIGTEVPVPGGARGELPNDKKNKVTPTSPDALRETVAVTKKAVVKAGREEAWERVIAVVAQPGVEFGDEDVFYYDREAALPLSRALDDVPGLVFEAHSTDYQTASGLRRMVEDHFCILKVGPALTFAYREALFALAAMENELVRDVDARSNLVNVLEDVMLDSAPNYWQKYYKGDAWQQRFKRRYSFSDRSRYYWTNKTLDFSVQRLYNNLIGLDIPLSLISQFMPDMFMAVSEGALQKTPEDLVTGRIQKAVTGVYVKACLLCNS
jgi:D-tagatose-1,6-bisphosphate aldolase subunit GatZ/KbaZ